MVTPRYFDRFLMTVIAINFELNENLPTLGLCYHPRPPYTLHLDYIHLKESVYGTLCPSE